MCEKCELGLDAYAYEISSDMTTFEQVKDLFNSNKILRTELIFWPESKEIVNTTYYSGIEVYSSVATIKYCPFCGRKLGGE